MQLDLPDGCAFPDIAAPPSPAPDFNPADFVIDVKAPSQELPQRAPAVALPREEPQIHANDAWPPPVPFQCQGFFMS